MAAGHVVLVGLVALLVGSLLNAAGIRKTALGQPVGIRRDIATFFANPLYDVSHFLHIDRLRVGLQDILGRDGDDDVDLSLPSPIIDSNGPPAATTTTTAPPRKRAFSPATPMTAWVGGDSLSVTPGESFVNVAPTTQVINIANNFVDGHVATGLARPEIFNWPAHMVDVINADNPDTVVLTIGSNDDQTLTGDGGGAPFGSADWIVEYTRRVGGMMDAITGDNKRVLFWIGVPIMRNLERSEQRYRIINDIYRTEAEMRPGRVVYVDTYDRFSAPGGGYADYLDGVQVRTPDGVHFSRAGGDQLAQVVLDAMNRVFDLTSWESSVTTTATRPISTVPAPTTETTAKTRK
jgi:hypothetical protein